MKKVLSLLLAIIFATGFSYSSGIAGFGSVVKAEESGSAVPDPVDLTTREDFDFGVNTHPKSYDAYPEVYMEEQIHAVARMGSKWIRFGGSIPEDGDWTYLDTMVGLCNQYGLKIIMVIFPEKDISLQHITTYCENFAYRYNGEDGRGYVDIFQVWNEEDHTLLKAKYGGSSPAGDNETQYFNFPVEGSADLPEYLEYFLAAEKGIHSQHSHSRFMVNFSMTHCGMISYFLRNGLQIDIVGWDLYVTQHEREEAAQRQIELYNLIEEKIYNVYHVPVMLAETNMDMKIVTEEERKKAETELGIYQQVIDNLYLGFRRPWLKGAVLYELLDEPIRGDSSEARYGLIRNVNGGIDVTDVNNEKPVYRELQRLLRGNRDLPVIKRGAVDLSPYEKIRVVTADESDLSVGGVFETLPDIDWPEDDFADGMESDEDQTVVHPVKKILQKETAYEIPWLMLILCGTGILLLAGGAVATFIILDKRKNK